MKLQFPVWAALSLAIFGPRLLGAEVSGAGTLEGVVQNARTGEYLNNANVTIEGTQSAALTDPFGRYRFTDLPAGTAKVRVFYTGMVTEEKTAAIGAGQTVRLDFDLQSAQAGRNETVELEKFVVNASRETNGAAIAINEQRFAPNMKSVVSTDEFGDVPDGNIGEFLKFMPGLSIDYNGGDARNISLGGAPTQYTPITVGGFDLASASSSTSGRTIELEQVSLNNVSRLEYIQSPTPDSPGNALAGSINLVPRSAFERSKPEFRYSAFLSMRDNAKDFHRTPGPLRDPEVKVHPGFDFSYVMPVSQRFGFTLAASSSKRYDNQGFVQLTWVGTLETPPTGSPYNEANPYLRDFVVDDGPKDTSRTSWSATLDFKPARDDVLSLGIQWAFFDAHWIHRSLTFSPNPTSVRPLAASPEFTHGAVGQGVLVIGGGGGLRKSGTTWMPNLTWRHNGRVWKAEAGVAHSQASNYYRDIDDGHFSTVSARRTGVTINYDDNFYLRPGTIAVFDNANRPLDPFDLNNYSIVSGSSAQRTSSDLRRSAYANLARQFDLGFPLGLKTGLDFRQQRRDIESTGITWNFVGADKKPSTSPVGQDDGAGILLDSSFSQRYLPYGFPRMQWPSNWTAWELYQAHPEYWTTNDVATRNSAVNNSKFAQEAVSAAYLRGDAAFLNRRLRLTTGLRAEQTNIKGEAVLVDPTRNWQRDPSGKVLRSAAGAPLLIAPAGSMQEAELTRLRRADVARKEYLRYFPSLNASYDLRENLILRGAYYWSIGRPDFGQYAGTLTLPDLESQPSPSNRISVNNPLIKPWRATTEKVSLEYYFQRVGVLSISTYQRDFKNFVVSAIEPATPEFLNAFALAPEYLRYDVSTQANTPNTVIVRGTDVNYKQALTFLPHWARGFTVFANYTKQRVTGLDAGNFTGGNFVPYTANWGGRLDRDLFSLNANWSYRSRLRQNYLAATDSYVFYNRRLYLDVGGELRLNRLLRIRPNLSLYAGLRNVLDQQEVDNEVLGPHTPPNAQLRSTWNFGSLWTFGLKGTF